ncbi:MAG: acyl-CoA synthetase [Actinobacteria bacterium]|nr:acyl-CoA synthetase [Actinomycetota bacterium]
MSFNIADLFEHAVDAVPDRTALIIGDVSRTYRELDDRANRLANRFLADGLAKGDHIGIYGVNSEAWMVTMLAAFKISAIPININYRYVAEELEYLFDNADLVAVVHDATYTPVVAEVVTSVAGVARLYAIDDASGVDTTQLGSVDFEAAVTSGAATRPAVIRSPDDLYVLYTGGTTGMPKGVMWRQEDVFFALGGGIEPYSGVPVESEFTLSEKAAASPAPLVTLCIPPLMHGAAQWGTLRFLFEGNTVVLVPRFDAELIWDEVERCGVQTLTITGDAMGRPLVETLIEHPGRWDTSSLFVIASSAAVFSQPVKKLFREQFPDAIMVDAIGSSETGHNGITTAADEQGPNREGLAVTVKGYEGSVVLDENLEPVVPGSGAIGRLARGGHIPVGYYKDEVKTAKTFVIAADGERYAIPGDFATVEADGTITLLGRGSVCINTGGEKVFPEEVEGAIKSHPAIYDAVVVGAPDDRWGERVTAIIQLRMASDRPTDDALVAHCRTRLAGYKVPRTIITVDEVVRSPSGKPDYPWAKTLAATSVSGDS